jgi:predicted heme/steroid binding protein
MGNRPYVWKGGEETDKYDAIIDCPHYVSQRRPHMSMIDRAAQFSPFDALEGYSDEIVETGRTTEERIELSDIQMVELNEKIGLLNEICIEAAHSRFAGSEMILPTVTITYFLPDKEINRHSQKNGGAYVSYSGQIRRVDMTPGTMTFQGKNGKHKTIAIADIIDIQGDFAERRTP